MNHSVMRIGGGITGEVQVGDTHRHGPYQGVVRKLEVAESRRQLSLRPHQLPCTSRQTVMDRAARAWHSLTVRDPLLEWKQDGCMNALDGSEDGLIGRDLAALWRELQMPTLRAQLVKEVQGEVKAGRLTDWWQYPELLEPYDDHPPLDDGWEDADPLVHPDDDRVADEEVHGARETDRLGLAAAGPLDARF